MNLQHLKYVVEVAKTGSIRQSAENLYMAQPNLSSALKELEAEIGIQIFKRSYKGVTVTQEGEEFLVYARSIVNQIENLAFIYRKQENSSFFIRFACERSSHMANLISEMINLINKDTSFNIQFMETSASNVLKAVSNQEMDLGKIAFQKDFFNYYENLIRSRELHMDILWEMEAYVLVSKNSPLASLEYISRKDLLSYTELIYGDHHSKDYPNIPVKISESEGIVTVWSRGSMVEIISNCPSCYMWVGATHESVMEKNNLIAKKCIDNPLIILEVLIYRKDKALTNEMSYLIDKIKSIEYTEKFRKQVKPNE